MHGIHDLQQWIRNTYVAMGFDPAHAWIETYTYAAAFPAFNGVGGNGTAIIQVNANADFVFTHASYAATLGTAITTETQPVPQVDVLVIDTGSARPFFNSAIPLSSFAGVNGGPPKLQAYPRWLAANTSISVQLIGYGTAAQTFSQLDVMLHGVSVRQASSPN